LASEQFENKINSKFVVQPKFALSPLYSIKSNGAQRVDHEKE